jgi:hypothetical protein
MSSNFCLQLHEHAALAGSLLQQNLLKRSITSGMSPMVKKQRRLMSNSHCTPPQ